jgi:hypothetical protein
MGTKRYHFLPSDTVRVPEGASYGVGRDGKKVGDLNVNWVRHMIARDRIWIERDGKRLEPTEKPPNVKRTKARRRGRTWGWRGAVRPSASQAAQAIKAAESGRGGRSYDLRADDVILVLGRDQVGGIHDGMRVGDANRDRLLDHLRSKRVAILREGKRIELKMVSGPLQTPLRPRPGKTVRACMCCRKQFYSDGIHNRLCDLCRRENEW